MTLASPSQAPLILVAEDDARLRRMLVHTLWRDGFRVISACDGAELERWIGRLILGAADGRYVDLIIADQRMRSATGLEVLTRLRRVDSTTPFILITRFSDTAIVLEAKRLGASCVFDQPLELDALRAIAQHLAKSMESWRQTT